MYALLWLIIAPLIIFTWNDQMIHSYFITLAVRLELHVLYLKAFFPPMLYDLGEDYTVGQDFTL